MQYQECHQLKWHYNVSPIWFPSEKIRSNTMIVDTALIPSMEVTEQNHKSSNSSWDESDFGIELLDTNVPPSSSATSNGLVRRGTKKKPAAMIMDTPNVDDIDDSKRRRHQRPQQRRHRRHNPPALDRITSAASSDSFSFSLLATLGSRYQQFR
mmetsp:Transcript_16335/g.25599  ORF Transcript_16335/g.25599 Transcript_16335/m.25599 type:complete len:154 (-) Transcript_16335:335-796(-)